MSMARNMVGLCLVTMVTVVGCGKSDSKQNASSISAMNEPVTFVVYSNTGLALDGGGLFDALVQALKTTSIDFAADLGNCLPAGTPPEGVAVIWEQVDESRRQIGVPIYPVAGTGDIFDQTSSAAYTARYGPRWYGFTRGNIRFLVLDTGDEAFREGFGDRPRISDEQMSWLAAELDAIPKSQTAVILMNRPLWSDDPSLWRDTLLPVLKTGPVGLLVTSTSRGLIDWGTIDGIRAVSTGCTGLSESAGPGLFPHMLLITAVDGSFSFRVLEPDSTLYEGIPVTTGTYDIIDDLTGQLTIPPLKTDPGWNVSSTAEITLTNEFDTAFNGLITFDVFGSPVWSIRPLEIPIAVRPGERTTYHVQISAPAPDLGPMPRYTVTLADSENILLNRSETLTLAVPRPRTGEVIAVKAEIPAAIPYDFNGSSLRIPVDVGSIDTCGRVAIYRDSDNTTPECVYISPLVNFTPGISTFTWDGRTLDGQPVSPCELTCYLFAYNKTAPATWVADGPPDPGGSFTVERTLAGLRLETQTTFGIVAYPLGTSITSPKAEPLQDFSSILGVQKLRGYARGADDHVYLATGNGLVSIYARSGDKVIDQAFGDNGYLRLTGYRGRTIGAPVYWNGRIYLGIGGGNGSTPSVLIIDSVTGELLDAIDLGAFYGEYKEPPALAASGRGLYCAHPQDRLAFLLNEAGDIIWTNDTGDPRVGDIDADGMSLSYGVGVDRNGFTYLPAPGTSARCGILGPDGRGLFRVILTQLAGLRVERAVPLIEGRDTDGIFFVTRGGDRPYVFHIPYTIRTGMIVPRTTTVVR
jgi:hypothetical protein